MSPFGGGGPLGGPRTAPGWYAMSLTADVADTTGSLVDSGLAFAPAANRIYHVEAYLIWTTAATTTGLQWTFLDPTSLGTGTTWSVQQIDVTTSINARVLRNDQLGAVVVGTGATSAAIPHSAQGWCRIRTAAAPSGSLKVQFQTEVGASAVTLLAGSEIRWRVVQ